MFQRQLRQCNFICKCKPNNSLVLLHKTLALAQLHTNCFFLFFCSFSFNLTDTCIALPSFLTLMRKKPLDVFTCLEDIFSPLLSQFCEPQKNLCQLNLVVLYVGESKTSLVQIRNLQILCFKAADHCSLHISC